MESNTLLSSQPGSSAACAGCSLWQGTRRHKTVEERIMEFYGHMPTREEIDAAYPKLLDWEPVAGAVGREVW
jgi:hypothetical protein